MAGICILGLDAGGEHYVTSVVATHLRGRYLCAWVGLYMANVMSLCVVNAYLPGRVLWASTARNGERHVIVCCKRTPTWPGPLGLGCMVMANVISLVQSMASTVLQPLCVLGTVYTAPSLVITL